MAGVGSRTGGTGHYAAVSVVREMPGCESDREDRVVSMKIGVVFPQTEIGADAGAVRLYAEAVSELGYDHILAYDHVVGADTRVHNGF